MLEENSTDFNFFLLYFKVNQSFKYIIIKKIILKLKN